MENETDISWIHSERPSHSERDHSQMALRFHAASAWSLSSSGLNRNFHTAEGADECTHKPYH